MMTYSCLHPKKVKRIKEETTAFSLRCFLLAKGQYHYGKKKKVIFHGENRSGGSIMFLKYQTEAMLSI